MTWLTSISSQVLTGIEAGESRELLILDPQGHIEYAAGAIDDGEALYLVTERSGAQGLADWLNSMRFALRVEVTLSQQLVDYWKALEIVVFPTMNRSR